MSIIEPGGIDCDIHPAVPNLKALHPYLSDHWRDVVVQRGVHELESIAYPANSPLTSRPDWRLPSGKPGSDLDALRAHALTPFGTAIAICNCLYGVQLLFSEDMGAGFARAVNDWMAAEWLDKEPRLRASHRGADAERRTGGGGDQPRRPGPPLRADPAAGDARPCRWASATTGRSTPRPRSTACRSASTPAAPIATRSRRWAGRPITPRTTPRRRRPSRPRCRRWSARVCSPNSPT